jgi:putative endonuclease
MRLPWPFSLFRTVSGSRTEAQRVGAWGEDQAADLLRGKGYKLLGQNVRFGSRCELDLVVRSPAPDVLVFVEVKTRRNEAFGRPMAAVDRNKRRTLGRAAARYLHRIKAKPAHIRFDVVEVVGKPGDENPVIRHIENAFSLGPGYRLPY